MRKRHEIPIIGENYPLIGDTIYWKDVDGNIHNDVVVDIEKDPDGIIVTNYFISRTENGGGCFIDEDGLIDPMSMELEVYKQKIAKEKEKEIANYISRTDVKQILYDKLKKAYYDEDTIYHILDVLTNTDY